MKNRLTDALIGLVICIAVLPIAFIATILLLPLWRWVESTFRLESVGHSGPAEWCYLLTYVLSLTLAGILWAWLRRSQQRGRA